MLFHTFTYTLLLAAASMASAATAPKQKPVEQPVTGSPTSQGCFSNHGNMTETKLLAKFSKAGVSSGNCRETCLAGDFTVMALSTQKCYCGVVYPPKDDRIKDFKCAFPCPGTGAEVCGDLGGISSVYNLGVEVDVPNYEPQESSTSSAAPSATKAPEDSKSSSVPADSTSSDSAETSAADGGGGDSGPSIGPIVGGVVGGVVVLAAVIGALVFFLRRRRNAEIEEEHRRNAAVNAFINGAKPPGSSGSISMTDSRLDPVMAHRRLSDGSIADNQDYSRRILRVTNA